MEKEMGKGEEKSASIKYYAHFIPGNCLNNRTIRFSP